MKNVLSYLLSCSIYVQQFCVIPGSWGVITEQISVEQDKTSQRKV